MLVRICDQCKTDVNVKVFFFPLERSMDAAGSMETTGRNLDLCPRCRMTLYVRVLRDKGMYEDFNFNKKLIDVFESIKINKK